MNKTLAGKSGSAHEIVLSGLYYGDIKIEDTFVFEYTRVSQPHHGGHLFELSAFFGEQFLESETVGGRESGEEQVQLLVGRVDGVHDVLTRQLQIQVDLDQTRRPRRRPQTICQRNGKGNREARNEKARMALTPEENG